LYQFNKELLDHNKNTQAIRRRCRELEELLQEQDIVEQVLYHKAKRFAKLKRKLQESGS
jgi:hypothetical protein